MNPVPLKIDVTGLGLAAENLQAIRNALADRRPLHAEMAGNALEFTRQYMLGTPRHNTATKLGATPTNFRARNATALSAESDDTAAILRIPRSTGLGRAFGDVTIKPLGGKRFLTVPATAETYGRQAGEWPRDTFDFAIIFTHRGPVPVLVWAQAGGRHKKRDVAFWLRREVTQRQDRTLLPPDDEYIGLARDTIVAHIQARISQTTSPRGSSGASGPYGGTSSGMPSA
jgi:hypothetical protein